MFLMDGACLFDEIKKRLVVEAMQVGVIHAGGGSFATKPSKQQEGRMVGENLHAEP
jgi:hypothetical protein